MSDSILTVLDLVRESLPANLIGNEGYSRLAGVARVLPLELTTFWGLECGLGRSDGMADVLLHTGRDSRGHRLLDGSLPSSLEALCRRWPVWQALRAFARLWADPGHPFHTHIRNIWMEFDTAAALCSEHFDDVVRRPCLFFGPEVKSRDTEVLLNLIPDMGAAMGRIVLERGGLKRFITGLPHGARVFQVGLMLARPTCALRLCVDQLPPRDIPAWLRRLSWKGDSDALGELLREIAPIVGSVAVDLDVTEDGAAEKLGLECYMEWQVDDPGQWGPLLDFLGERGLCLPRKRQALAAFPGISRCDSSRRLSGNGILYVGFVRKIHHLKLSFVGRSTFEAKVYLALSRPGVDLRGMLVRSPEPADAWLIE